MLATIRDYASRSHGVTKAKKERSVANNNEKLHLTPTGLLTEGAYTY
jgi:hypothetical protein